MLRPTHLPLHPAATSPTHSAMKQSDFVFLSLLRCHFHAPFSLFGCVSRRQTVPTRGQTAVQLSGPPSQARTLPRPEATDACCPHVAGTSSVWFRVMFSSLPGQLHESSSSALPWWPQHATSVRGLGRQSTTCRCIKRQNRFLRELFSVTEAFGGSCCPAEDKKGKSGPRG